MKYWIITSQGKHWDHGYWTKHSSLLDAMRCAYRMGGISVYEVNYDKDTRCEMWMQIAYVDNEHNLNWRFPK